MDMRVDEGRSEHEPTPFDDPVAVRVDVQADLRDHASVDADVEELVDPESRVEHARATDDEVVRALPPVQHHATSPTTSALTSTGPRVSRS
jgi:hypothetical protein